MSEIIDAIIKTRETSAQIAYEALANVENISEIELHTLILDKMSTHDNIFPKGYYDPPPGGVSVLFDEAPFERLVYGSLREEKYWPDKQHTFTKEAIGQVYFSPVNKTTKTLADIGFTVYRGGNEEIKRHFKKSYDVVHKIAEHAQVGDTFSGLCAFAIDLFAANGLKPSKRVITTSNQKQSLNLGHTIPGSFDGNLVSGNSFEEIKESITVKRIQCIDTENFKIPATCAFTVESRLEDAKNPSMPSASWHFIVCFDEGKKTILDNYKEIFKTVGMEYMNSN